MSYKLYLQCACHCDKCDRSPDVRRPTGNRDVPTNIVANKQQQKVIQLNYSCI